MIIPIGLLAAVLAIPQVPPPRTGAGIASELRAERTRILEHEVTQLQDLAKALDRDGKPDEATAVRELVEPIQPPEDPIRFVPLPEFTPAAVREAPSKGRAVRLETARALSDLASRASAPGSERFGIAVECLRDVLARDSNNREARRLLGFVPHDGGWATPQAAANLKAGKVLDPIFGWVSADWVPHLKRGELPGIASGNKPVPWLPADEANALRSDFSKRPWEITTAHFAIVTNVPLAEAIPFGRRLEDLHAVFFTYFADIFDPKDLPFAQRVRDPSRWASVEPKRQQIWYFATQEEYIETLRKRFGINEEVSLGYYMPKSESLKVRQPPRSYFYRDPDNPIDTTSTLFHEASHQILFEACTMDGHSSNVGQYWIWEGLGTYFETLKPQPDGSYRLGGWTGPRVAEARRAFTKENWLVPIADLVAMSKVRFTADDGGGSKRYNEVPALVVFLMHADGGRYREGFLDYVADALRGRFRPSGAGRPLPERIGLSASELDAKFRQFLKNKEGADPVRTRAADRNQADHSPT